LTFVTVVALPPLVMIKALGLLSMNVVDWHVNRDTVPVMVVAAPGPVEPTAAVVYGPVGGIKLFEYSPWPFITRILEIKPLSHDVAELFQSDPKLTLPIR